MPRTKLDADYRIKRTHKLIQLALQEAGKRQKDIAKLLYVSPETVSYKLRKGRLTVDDFQTIIDACQLDDKTIIKILRG